MYYFLKREHIGLVCAWLITTKGQLEYKCRYVEKGENDVIEVRGAQDSSLANKGVKLVN